MKHNSYVAIALLAAGLVFSSSSLFAKDSEGTLDKIAKSGEILIGYRTDASPLPNAINAVPP